MMGGGWMSALGGMGGVGSLGGAAGGAASAGGGFMSTLGKIGKGLGNAAQTFNSMGGFTGQGGQQRPVSGWADASQQPNALQDEVKRQLEAMKQERILQDLMRYQPLEGQGGVSGLTINPYR